MFVPYNSILHKEVVDVEQVLPPELFAIVHGYPREIIWPVGEMLNQGYVEQNHQGIDATQSGKTKRRMNEC